MMKTGPSFGTGGRSERKSVLFLPPLPGSGTMPNCSGVHAFATRAHSRLRSSDSSPFALCHLTSAALMSSACVSSRLTHADLSDGSVA